mmetsp:Transcript_104954/g.203138  ORF Transcript_104954/g.203138 Transcript_104954/m.203138 type:complete len:616 (+) Transcript_104954:80-1927(+)
MACSKLVASLSVGTVLVSYLALRKINKMRREVAPLWRTEEELKAKEGANLDSDDLVKSGYTAAKVEAMGPLDVVVIGSGLSGLTTAAMLARQGLKVLVLEQHDQAGGNCHTFSKKYVQGEQEFEFEFDTGVHYLGGQLDNPRAPLRKLYDYVTGGVVQWGRLDDVYDVAVCTGENKTDPAESFEFSSNFGETELRLAKRFGEKQRPAISSFFAELGRTTSMVVVGWFMWKLGAPKLFAMPFLSYARRTTRDFMNAMPGMTPKLMGVLTYCYGDHGSQPSRSSWAVQALISKHYEGGAFFPKGGPSRIAKASVAVIRKFGGAVLVRAPVAKILTGPHGAYGVRLERGGVEINAKRVVSAAGARNTYLKLLPPQGQDLAGPIVQALRMHEDVVAQAAGKTSGLEPSVCMVCLFVGLDESDEVLQLPRTNFWRFPSWDHDKNMEDFLADSSKPLPGVFVSTSSSKDADWGKRHPGISTVQVLAPVNYDWFIAYENTKLQARGAEYQRYKEHWTQLLLEHLYDQFPQVRGHVAFTELGTPLTNNHFMATTEGEVYGIAHTTQRYSQWQSDLKPSTPVPGLFLTGQDIFCDGVGAALVAGALTAFRMSSACALQNVGLFL